MSTPNQSPVTREEWEVKLMGLNSPFSDDPPEDLRKALDSIMSLQSQLTAAREEVERLRANDVMRLFDVDRHKFSTRPCSTCAAISTVTKKDFGCTAMRIEKARQPK